MSRVFISIKQLVCSCFHILQDGFLRWARPLNTSLLLGTLADLARGKSELVADASEGESLDHRVDQGDGQEQPTLGSGTDPWRITQAGYSRVPAARSKSTCDVCARLNHGDRTGELFSAIMQEKCGLAMRLQVTDLLFRSLFAFFDTLAAIAQSDPCRCDALSYRRVDRTTAAGGHSVWTHAEISHARS